MISLSDEIIVAWARENTELTGDKFNIYALVKSADSFFRIEKIHSEDWNEKMYALASSSAAVCSALTEAVEDGS